MADDLPTLKGLRAFEEAFRLQSYTAAAQKLNVQQPAVSYQIKRLEEDLGVPLFVKEKGRLEPTSAAIELFDTVNMSFNSIRKTCKRLRHMTHTPTFTIATYPGIGTHWLSSRLPRLTQALSVPVKIVTLVDDADILNEPADCRILFGTGTVPGHDALLLMPESVCPVAAPDLAAKFRFSTHQALPEDVAIIEQDDPQGRWISWTDWQAQTKDQTALPKDRLRVNDHGLALHLALGGIGITLAWMGVVEDLLAGGSLVPLDDKIATSGSGYWLAGEPGFFDTPEGQIIVKQLIDPVNGAPQGPG